MGSGTSGMELYRRAQDGFEEVLAAVGPDQWDAPSACAEWSVRDVAGHVVWGQRQIQAWATGTPDPDRAGAPGSPHPGVLAGSDPLATWRAARRESVATLTDEALRRTTTITGIGEVPLAAVLTLLTTDLMVHTWDVGHGLGMEVRIDLELLDLGFEWARQGNAVRRPGFFGPEVAPPAGSDEQTRFLAYLGRTPWVPAAA